MAKAYLQEPIYRRQEGEKEEDYKLFLIYRDIQWDERSLKRATSIATNVHENLVAKPHDTIIKCSHQWQWAQRAKAYDLYIQENTSERQERILLQTRSDLEHIIMRLTGRIKRLERITMSDLNDPQIQEDMKIVEAFVDKGRIGTWLLDTYRTLYGQKMKVMTPAQMNLPELEWKEVKDAA